MPVDVSFCLSQFVSALVAGVDGCVGTGRTPSLRVQARDPGTGPRSGWGAAVLLASPRAEVRRAVLPRKAPE